MGETMMPHTDIITQQCPTLSSIDWQASTDEFLDIYPDLHLFDLGLLQAIAEQK